MRHGFSDITIMEREWTARRALGATH